MSHKQNHVDRKEFLCEPSSDVCSWLSCLWQVCSGRHRLLWPETIIHLLIITAIIITAIITATGEEMPIAILIMMVAAGTGARTAMAITGLIQIGIDGTAIMTRNSSASVN
jgi:hypothetical protein